MRSTVFGWKNENLCHTSVIDAVGRSEVVDFKPSIEPDRRIYLSSEMVWFLASLFKEFVVGRL